MKRFLNLIVYILSVHLSALIITGLFRGVLFISSYHQLTAEALSDKSLSLIAFVHGVRDRLLHITASADGSCSLWALQLLWEGFIPFLHYLLRCLLWVGLSDQCG